MLAKLLRLLCPKPRRRLGWSIQYRRCQAGLQVACCLRAEKSGRYAFTPLQERGPHSGWVRSVN